MCTQLYLKWITNKNVLYSTWNSIQCYTPARIRGGFGAEWTHIWGFPGGSDGKASVCSAGDTGSIPGLGRSPREGNGSPLQYSCLGNPMAPEPGRLPSIGSQRVGHD